MPYVLDGGVELFSREEVLLGILLIRIDAVGQGKQGEGERVVGLNGTDVTNITLYDQRGDSLPVLLTVHEQGALIEFVVVLECSLEGSSVEPRNPQIDFGMKLVLVHRISGCARTRQEIPW